MGHIVKGLCWNFLLAWAILIGLVWNAEESSKLNTIVVILIVFAIAVVIINQARKWQIIESALDWMFVFMLMVTLMSLTLHYGWIMTEIVQEYKGPDPVRFDAAARQIVESGMDFTRFQRSINFLGVLYYISSIYHVFGVSTFYVSLFNSLFCLTTFLSVTALLVSSTSLVAPWQNMRWGMLLPLVVYYTATPGKDIPAICFFVLSICAVIHLLDRRSLRWLSVMIVSLACLAVVRGTAVFLVLLAATVLFLFGAKGRTRVLMFVLSVVILIFFVFVVPAIVDFSGGSIVSLGEAFDLQSKLEFAKAHSVEGSLNLLISPRNHIQLFLFMPVRTIFLLVAPFPNLRFFAEAKGVEWYVRCTSIESLIILFFFPAMLAATLDKRCREQIAYKFIVVLFWGVLTAISVALFIVHERYRVMVMPFWLATVLLGLHYGRPKRYVVPGLFLVNVGFLLYFVLKFTIAG